MSDPRPQRSGPTGLDLEWEIARFLEESDLPTPDEMSPRADGGVLVLWHKEKVALIVDPSGEPRSA